MAMLIGASAAGEEEVAVAPLNWPFAVKLPPQSGSRRRAGRGRFRQRRSCRRKSSRRRRLQEWKCGWNREGNAGDGASSILFHSLS